MSINLLPWRENKLKKQAIFILASSVMIALIVCIIMTLVRQQIELITTQNNIINDRLQKELDQYSHATNKKVILHFNQYLMQARIIKKSLNDFKQIIQALDWLCQNHSNISFAQISIAPPNILIQATSSQSGLATQWTKQIVHSNLFSNAVISQIQSSSNGENVHFEINLILKQGEVDGA